MRIPSGVPDMTSDNPDDPPRHGWGRWLPGLWTLSRYRATDFLPDAFAGLALTAVLVPVGVAYAVASGVPAISGLYATIAALIAYALFGPSRTLVVGPDSSLIVLVLGVVLSLSADDPQRAVAIAAAVTLVSGALCALAGIGRLGFITELLSKPIRYGYMNGIALTVIASQLAPLLGVQSSGGRLLSMAGSTISEAAAGNVNAASLTLGIVALLALFAAKVVPRLPGVLAVVVLATAVVGIFDLDETHGVAVLGSLPQGLPLPSLPLIGIDDLVPILMGGMAVALVSFADMSVLSRTFAARADARVDPNQELVALGAANLAAGFFQGIPVGPSASRTPVAQDAGARTQATGLVGALGVAALLVFAPGLLAELPRAVLAAVVIAAALSLIEIRGLIRIFRIQQWEFWLSLICLAGVVVVGPTRGIAIAVSIAVVEFLWDAWRPHSAVLGRVENLKGYHDVSRYPEATQVPGLVLFRWDAPLFFANAEFFRTRLLAAVAESPTPVRWVVVGAAPITNVDVTAADTLDALDHELERAGIDLRFAELKDPVKDQLKRFGLFEQFGKERFFPTMGQAVSGYVAAHDVEWIDWEDRPRRRPRTRRTSEAGRETKR